MTIHYQISHVTSLLYTLPTHTIWLVCIFSNDSRARNAPFHTCLFTRQQRRQAYNHWLILRVLYSFAASNALPMAQHILIWKHGRLPWDTLAHIGLFSGTWSQLPVYCDTRSRCRDCSGYNSPCIGLESDDVTLVLKLGLNYKQDGRTIQSVWLPGPETTKSKRNKKWVFESALSFSSESWILGPTLVWLRLIRALRESLKLTWTGYILFLILACTTAETCRALFSKKKKDANHRHFHGACHQHRVAVKKRSYTGERHWSHGNLRLQVGSDSYEGGCRKRSQNCKIDPKTYTFSASAIWRVLSTSFWLLRSVTVHLPALLHGSLEVWKYKNI